MEALSQDCSALLKYIQKLFETYDNWNSAAKVTAWYLREDVNISN